VTQALDPDSASAGPALSQDNWRQAPKVAAWEKSLASAGCVLEAVELLQGLRKRDGSLLFALLRVAGRNAEGHPLLPYVLIQGPAVLVVPAITIAETGEEKFLMANQCRMGHGRYSLEFPAGMLDEKVDDPGEIAVHELEEEVGLKIRREELIPLNDKPYYPSPGLSDEGIWFFAYRRTLSLSDGEALQGKALGVAAEGEHIGVELLSREDIIPRLDSMQSILALSLYDGRFNR